MKAWRVIKKIMSLLFVAALVVSSGSLFMQIGSSTNAPAASAPQRWSLACPKDW